MSGRDRSAALGITLLPDGARARIRSDGAEQVWLCLFDGVDSVESERLPLERGPDGVWEGTFAGLAAGQVYGVRAAGPHAPGRGQRFDRAKLLLDPYARAVVGGVRWRPEIEARAHGVDSAAVAPRGVITASAFDWQGDRHPRTPWAETVLYEAHVKGLTRLHPEVPEEARGTYLGLAHPAVVEHLVSLGITAVELMPVQQSFTERHLVESGLTNYWGYNPVAFFAPDAGYAAGTDPVGEFKEMVRRLHAAGLEVILDVVFNHTAEGDAEGPTLSFKGLDNELYYRLDPGDRSRYLNYSGCGNTLDFGRRRVVGLALDCLRYWVEEMHVDGFRFDLAVALGRGRSGRFEPRGPFFEAVAAEPVLARTKLIAEPWDLGPDGYQLGRFPSGWREWNDRFRDCVRAYWLGDPGVSEELRLRLAGSPDLFPAARGREQASINYVTSHDGFTLADLVSYERRHNQLNGERNRDGHPDELSGNFGVEGPSDEPAVVERRRRARRGMLAALALARGVPMIAHGDELGRTQRGNNNAYCQDNPISWVDWRSASARHGPAALLRWLLRLRKRLLRAGGRRRGTEEDRG